MKISQDDMFDRAIEVFGTEHLMMKFLEESTELNLAILHHPKRMT